MLLIQTQRDTLLKPLQAVTGIVERRHTLPILSNVLIEAQQDKISFMATDLEIQISTYALRDSGPDYSITVSAKKLQDILSLPEKIKHRRVLKLKYVIIIIISYYHYLLLPGSGFSILWLTGKSPGKRNA